MNEQEYFGTIARQKKTIHRQGWWLSLLILVTVVQALTIRSNTGDERQAFIPPEISRPFWVSATDASQSYFEDLGQFINSLPLNVTPETIGKACSQYLTYILPRDRDIYQRKCELQEMRVKRDGASSMCATKEIQTDLKHRKVAITCQLTSIVSGQAFPPGTKTFTMEFVPFGGRMYITNHEEVNPDDPFANKK